MITSSSNPKIKLVRELQSRRKEREAQKLFVVEGVRLVEEAARAKARAALVLHTSDLDARAKAAVDQLARLGAQVETVSPSVMAAASETKTPQGILVVVPLPAASRLLPTALSFALVLDRIADPGNLGAILRTADAAGVEAVFLAPGAVDAYNPKVVRVAMGAHFHLPITQLPWDELAQQLAGLDMWLAEARAGEPYDQVDWRKPCALVIGSEAEGPSEEARRFAQKRVHIPMPGQAESLNAAVAAGVLLFEAARQRRTADRKACR